MVSYCLWSEPSHWAVLLSNKPVRVCEDNWAMLSEHVESEDMMWRERVFPSRPRAPPANSAELDAFAERWLGAWKTHRAAPECWNQCQDNSGDCPRYKRTLPAPQPQAWRLEETQRERWIRRPKQMGRMDRKPMEKLGETLSRVSSLRSGKGERWSLLNVNL